MTLDTLYKAIAETNPSLPGWCELDKSITLASMVVSMRPEVSLEIGVFGGRSFIPVALAHKAIGHGIAIAVDPWERLAAVAVQPTEADRKWWGDQDMNAIHAGFIAQINTLKLTDRVKVVRQQSKFFDAPSRIDLLHIDGGHDETAIQDVVRFAPKVSLGGIVVLDDLHYTGQAVTQAAQRLITIGFVKLYHLGTGAVFRRIR